MKVEPRGSGSGANKNKMPNVELWRFDPCPEGGSAGTSEWSKDEKGKTLAMAAQVMPPMESFVPEPQALTNVGYVAQHRNLPSDACVPFVV